MITAKFIGGYMDGEVMALKEPYPFWKFPRLQPLLSYTEWSKLDISKPVPVHEEVYEQDGYSDNVVYYRHNRVASAIRRYYL